MSHSEETKRAAVAAYESGLTAEEVGAELLVAPCSVLVWCRARGVSTRSKGGARRSIPAPTNLGRLLQSRRLELDLTLQDVKTLVRCSATHFNQVEIGGKGLGLLLAGRIAVAFGIPLQDLADAAERDAQEKEASK